MKAIIETLKFTDSNGEKYNLYPRTLIDCITNQNGDNLEDTLKAFIIELINSGVADDTVDATETFNDDGSITTTYADGSTEQTVFNSDGSITKTTSVGDVVTQTETTTFNADGSISTTYEKGV